MNKIKNFGYIEREITEDNYILGGILSAPFEILQESGQWNDFLPENEEQRKEGFDTFGCTQYATLNALEILIKRKFGEIKNYSERYVGVMAENIPTGNDPHNTAEAIRHFGNVDDYQLPFSVNLKSFEEYYAPKPMTKHYLDIGNNWLKEYDLKHEWVFGNFTSLKNKQIKIKEALKSSPVGVSVVAWFERNELYYKPEGQRENHWTICIGYKENEYWIIYDSYDGYIKKLEWNYDFGRAKRYWMEKKKEFIKLSIIAKILDLMKQALKLMFQQAEQIKEKEVEIPPVAKYLWDTKENARHSVRLICDEEKLSLADKNLICAVIQAESEFDNTKFHKNTNGTTDWGICMFNDGKNKNGVPYWIGNGAIFSSVDEVKNNPEKAVRVMVKEFKKGNLKYWVSYTNKAYLKFL